MDTLYENVILNNLSRLCKSHTPKVTIGKMCNDLGLSRSLITKLKADPKKTITGDTAQKIADYFGVSVDRVLGFEQKNKPAPENGNELSKDYADIVRTVDDVRSSDEPVTTDEFIEMLKRNNIIRAGHDFDEADYRFVESQINMLNSWFKKD